MYMYRYTYKHTCINIYIYILYIHIHIFTCVLQPVSSKIGAMFFKLPALRCCRGCDRHRRLLLRRLRLLLRRQLCGCGVRGLSG